MRRWVSAVPEAADIVDVAAQAAAASAVSKHEKDRYWVSWLVKQSVVPELELELGVSATGRLGSVRLCVFGNVEVALDLHVLSRLPSSIL